MCVLFALLARYISRDACGGHSRASTASNEFVYYFNWYRLWKSNARHRFQQTSKNTCMIYASLCFLTCVTFVRFSAEWCSSGSTTYLALKILELFFRSTYINSLHSNKVSRSTLCIRRNSGVALLSSQRKLCICIGVVCLRMMLKIRRSYLKKYNINSAFLFFSQSRSVPPEALTFPIAMVSQITGCSCNFVTVLFDVLLSNVQWSEFIHHDV